MGCLGKLVKLTDKEEIRTLLKDIFILGLFETTGPIQGSSELSLGQKVKNKLMKLIIGAYAVLFNFSSKMVEYNTYTCHKFIQGTIFKK